MPPRIYIACLVSYTGGHPHGCWTPPPTFKQSKTRPRDSPIPDAQAWFILDMVGFGGLVDEYDDITNIAEIGAAIAQHGPAFIAYASRVGAEHTTRRVPDGVYIIAR